QNTVALPMQVWNTAQGDIMQIRSILNAAQILGGNAASFTQRLARLGMYANQLSSLTSMTNQYQNWANIAGQHVTHLQKALGLSETQRASDTQMAQVLEQQSQNAVGQMQALQAGNRIATLGVAQLEKLQAMIQAELQMQLDHETVAADRRRC